MRQKINATWAVIEGGWNYGVSVYLFSLLNELRI